jgi:PAS domain S-box-containing protein
MGFQIDADDLQEIVALCDQDGILTSWNKAAEEITGFKGEEVLGYHLDSIVARSSRKDLEAILAAERMGNLLPGLSLRLQSTFGMEIPVEVTSLPRRTGETISGWLLLFRDTTLKVQLQEHLDRMDVLYRSLVENSPAIIYVLDSDGKVLFINDTVEALLGYGKADLLGTELIDLVHPEDRQTAYWPLRERRTALRATSNLEIRMMTKTGSIRRYDLDFVYVSLNSVGLAGPVPSGGGRADGVEPMGTQGIARDVTELTLLRDFSRQVGLILPICSVCRKIRVTAGPAEEWLSIDEYVTRKTGILFSHTYCPDHLPRER